MAEEFIPVHEKDLGALASGRTAAKVRGVDDLGHSVNLTPAQLATMAGIDYSVVNVEKEVPGEFWMGSDGVKRQVYWITFKGTTPPNSEGMMIASGFRDYEIVRSVVASGAYALKFNKVAWTGSALSVNLMAELTLYNGALILACYQSYTQNKPFILTIKFVKQ